MSITENRLGLSRNAHTFVVEKSLKSEQSGWPADWNPSYIVEALSLDPDSVHTVHSPDNSSEIIGYRMRFGKKEDGLQSELFFFPGLNKIKLTYTDESGNDPMNLDYIVNNPPEAVNPDHKSIYHAIRFRGSKIKGITSEENPPQTQDLNVSIYRSGFYTEVILPKEPVAHVTFSDREMEVLRLLQRAESAKEIASELGISIHTARAHIKNTINKLSMHGVHSQLDAVTYCLNNDILEKPEISTQEIEIPLARREVEVIQMLAQGGTTESITTALGITVNTFKAHLKHIAIKLDSHSRIEAVDIALRNGLIALPWR